MQNYILLSVLKLISSEEKLQKSVTTMNIINQGWKLFLSVFFSTVGDRCGEKKVTSRLPETRATNVELQLLQVTHWFNQLMIK